jgi:hypothetical protein
MSIGARATGNDVHIRPNTAIGVATRGLQCAACPEQPVLEADAPVAETRVGDRPDALFEEATLVRLEIVPDQMPEAQLWRVLISAATLANGRNTGPRFRGFVRGLLVDSCALAHRLPVQKVKTYEI